MRKGQITLFVIIAILIVGSVGTVVYLRGQSARQKANAEQMTLESVAAEIRPVERYFLDCLREKARDGLDLAGQQAGYITLPPDETASTYMPSSDKLDFLGTKVHYWWYISENNLVKARVPKISDIENDLDAYVNRISSECDLNQFFSQGFDVEAEEGITTNSTISDDWVDFTITKKISVSYGNTTGTIEKHSFRLPIKLGRMYNNAVAVYNSEQNGLFLENYSVDVLAMYAPLSGFELSCAPMFWSVANVQDDIKNALEGNIGAMKLKGDYYRLSKSQNKYFVQNIPAESGIDVNFLYNKDWPTKIEVEPNTNGIMTATPVGMQEGVGALGFCFISYHFVYDLDYPVLVQFYDSSQNYLFQFPVIVSVFKNKPREAELSSSMSAERELCTKKIQDEVVNTYDVNGNPVEARISFKCLNTVCEIGNTELSEEGATLIDKFPQCVNGFIIANAENYVPAKQQVSTNEAGIFNIILQPLHEIKVNMDGAENGKVVLVASKGDYTTTLMWPEQDKIKLAEGDYTIKAWLLKNGTFKLAEQSTQQCVKAPVGGIAGLLGAQKEECFDINIPEITLDELPAGGAFLNFSVGEDDLKEAREITFYMNSFQLPTTQDELVDIYTLIESSEARQPELK